MIKTDCPKCQSPLRAPDEYAGKTPRCPVCKTPVPAPAMAPIATALAEPPVNPAGVEQLLKDLVEIPPEKAAKPGKSSPRPLKKPEPVRAGHHHGPWVAVAFVIGITAFLGVTFLAVRYVVKASRVRNVEAILAELSSDLGPLEQDKAKADETHKAGAEKAGAEKYDEARALFEEAKQLYTGLLPRATRLKQHVDDYCEQYASAGNLDEALSAQQKVNGIVKDINAALAGEDLIKGLEAGKYVFYQGKWITADDKNRLFEEEMKRQGMVFYGSKWVTPDDVKRTQGLTLHRGKWLTASELAVAQAQEAQEEALAERARRDQAAVAERLMADARKKADMFAPDKPAWVVDDFSGGNRWQTMEWANPCDLKLVATRQGQRLVVKPRIVVGKESKDKWAIQLPIGLDMRSRASLVFAIDNPGKRPMSVALALNTSAFFESREKPVQPGVQQVSFDLTAGDFKSQATGWQHTTRVNDLGSVHQIFLMIYTSPDDAFYIDSVNGKKSK